MWRNLASSTCVKTTVKLCVLGRMSCELHDIVKESFGFMPVVRYFSMICELCCKCWVDRCYRHPLQSCMPCGACVWGSKHMHTRRHACTHMCDRMLCHAYTDVNQWRGFNTCNYQFLHWKVLLCHWLLVCLGLSSLYGFHLNMDFSLRIATCCGSTGIVTLG
jgi:hypothetical protein